jgi:ATP-dependent Clp protease protease subunit
MRNEKPSLITESIKASIQAACDPTEGADIIMVTSDNNQNSDASEILRSKGIYYITGEIEEDSLLSIHQDVLLKHINPEWKDDIQIFVNSPGGSPVELWSFVDLLDFIRMDVWTTAIGEVCSAGGIIVAAGTHGKRRMTPNASFMVHQFSGGISGNYAQLTAQATWLHQEQARHLRFWKKHSNLKNDADLCKNLLLEVDNYLTPEQALAFGIVDEIIGSQKTVVPEPPPTVTDKTTFPIKIPFAKKAARPKKARPACKSSTKGK